LYTTVVNSRRKRPRQRTPEQQRQQQSATTSQQQQPAPGLRAPTLVGKPKTGSTIAAVKKLREKSVFCVASSRSAFGVLLQKNALYKFTVIINFAKLIDKKTQHVM